MCHDCYVRIWNYLDICLAFQGNLSQGTNHHITSLPIPVCVYTTMLACGHILQILSARLNISRKLNVLVHLHGNAGLLPECSVGDRRGDGSRLRMNGTLLLLCHSSYRPTINGRLLTDHIKLYMADWDHFRSCINTFINATDSAHNFSVKLNLRMCMLAACSGSHPQCFTLSNKTIWWAERREHPKDVSYISGSKLSLWHTQHAYPRSDHLIAILYLKWWTCSNLVSCRKMRGHWW